MELTKHTELGNLKFSEPANIGSFKKVTVRNENGKPLLIATGKCFSFGVKKDVKYKSVSMSLVLDDDTVGTFETILSQCEKHLGKSLSKTLYYRDDGTVTIYAKLKMAKGNILTKFYRDGGEIDPMTYEGKHCEAKAVLAIEGVILNGEKANLQVKIDDANVREKVYEHVRLVDLER